MNQPLTRRAAVLLFCLAAAASLRAGQQPASPTTPAPGLANQFPGIPAGSGFPLAPNTRQFFTIPEVKQFPSPSNRNLKLPMVEVQTARQQAPRVVCGMVVVAGNADLDRKILRPVDPDAPKGIIESVEGKCEAAAVTVDPVPAAAPAR